MTGAVAAWMLLAQLSSIFTVRTSLFSCGAHVIESGFQVDCRLARVQWYALNNSSDRMVGYMAQIFASAAKKMRDSDRSELRENVAEKLETFRSAS